ncbi:diguanylate cyclase [Billgrantia pellis]|uniref:diguanylate cyclase n=1 Tax=Billgrantia pellis TaxID=2606936 RepID=A0A7V7KJ77_9GAMM|nr:diguanylate cyclase [Halomonas pellis]KAA0014539.1 diguanylate cyclase [Halomonas pellis]
MTVALTSLRHRFFLALLGVLCLALLALVLVARLQIMPILLEDEEAFASAELDRAERALDSELGHMHRLVEDWAYWDDTYDFVHGKRPEYVDSNLYEDTLDTLDLALMVFLDGDSEPYWIAGFDEKGEFTSCPGIQPPCDWAAPAMRHLRQPIDNGFEEATQTWLLALPPLAMGALSPIHQNREDASSAGWLAMVRPLSESRIGQLRDTTGIDLRFDIVGAGSLPRESLERISPTHMTASRHVAAIPTSHAVRIDALLPRQRYQASLETFRFALYWTGGVLVMTLLVVLWLLEHMILAPLRQFSRYTQRLHHDAVPPSMPGGLLMRRDEIGTLAREFRNLLTHQQQQSALLLEMTQHDPLTGIANRRLFDERLEEQLDGSPRHRRVAAMMIDIDHFKLYNDHYGHQAGDACLMTLAECMEEKLSVYGFLVARTGGEEFSVLLPNTSLDTAVAHAEALLRAVSDLGLPHATSPTGRHVTVSIGVAAHVPGQLTTPADIMRAADQALYRAKAGGRNRIHAYHPVADSVPQE